MPVSEPTAWERFAGIGGAHQACIASNIRVLFAVDHDQRVSDIYRDTYPTARAYCCDIRDRSWLRGYVDHVQNDNLRFLIATPPCPAFSHLADQPGCTCPNGRLADAVFETALIGQVPWFLIEEVAGLLTSRNGDDLRETRALARQHGYVTAVIRADASRVVPQRRPRVFFHGIRADLASPEICAIVLESASRLWTVPTPCLAWWRVPLPFAVLDERQMRECFSRPARKPSIGTLRTCPRATSVTRRM